MSTAASSPTSGSTPASTTPTSTPTSTPTPTPTPTSTPTPTPTPTPTSTPTPTPASAPKFSVRELLDYVIQKAKEYVQQCAQNQKQGKKNTPESAELRVGLVDLLVMLLKQLIEMSMHKKGNAHMSPVHQIFNANYSGSYTTSSRTYRHQGQSDHRTDTPNAQPEQTMDCYKELGVDRDASPAQIKKAYYKEARKHHPDKNPDNPNADEKMKMVNEAYETLSDPTKRAQHDRANPSAGKSAENNTAGSSNSSSTAAGPKPK